MLNYLQVLRAFSAFLVLGYHWHFMLHDTTVQGFADALFSKGYVGVDIFFVLSGFMMAFVTQPDRPESQAHVFLIRRIFRIIPLMWVVILITAYTRNANFLSPDHLRPIFKAMIFVLDDITPPQYGRGLIDVLWTLTFEVIFYITFFCALIFKGSNRVMLASLLLVFMVCVTQILYSGTITFNTDLAPSYSGESYFSSILSLIANPYFFEFIPGMALGLLFIKLKPRRYVYLVSGIALIMLFVYGYSHYCQINHKLISTMPWVSCLVAGVLCIQKDLFYFECPKVLYFWGNLAFSLYLIHLPVHDVLNRYEIFVSLKDLPGIPKFLAYGGITLTLSFLLYYFIEQPFIRIGRRLGAYRSTAS